MKEILTEWRKFLKEQKTKLIKEISASNMKDAGFSIGELLKKQINNAVKKHKTEDLIKEFPEWLEKAKKLTKKEAPNTYEFIDGMADGADIDFDVAFGTWYEELNYAKNKEKVKDEGCTDIIVINNKTVMIGHTNDETPGDGSKLIKLSIKDKPVIYGCFTRGVPSIGLNENGLVISGNQIDANDTKPGIPRMVLYFEALFSKNIKEAQNILLNSKRASSFNNILADESGEVVSLEASSEEEKKTNHSDGIDAHTNHFISLKNKEGRKGDNLDRSMKRLERALTDAKEKGNKMSVEDMKEVMKSHGEGGLCRHVEDEKDTATVFSIIFLPRERKFVYGDGNPCKTKYVEVEY